MKNTIFNIDCLEGLKSLPEQSVNCCITSPPYYGLRDYGVSGQLGLESSPDEYVTKLVDVFQEVRRVLRDDGTLWLNLGDSYAGSNKGFGNDPKREKFTRQNEEALPGICPKISGLKSKDLIGIPWRVAFALQADGWYLRSDIIWNKPNAMPQSVKDRPTKSHEYIFLLSKSKNYYYDSESIKEPLSPNSDVAYRNQLRKNKQYDTKAPYLKNTPASFDMTGKNKRSVWNVATKPFKGAHFATFPPDLIEPCILAGSPEGGIILDPFMGAATTAVTAFELERNYIGFELNSEYCKIGEQRLEEAKRKKEALGIPLFEEGVV